MALFELTAYDRAVYEQQLRPFLPEKMLDVHAHVWLKANNPPKPHSDRTVSWPDLVAADNSIEDLQETYRLLFPGKQVQALIFADTDATDISNDYVVQCSKKAGFPALYFSDPSQSADAVEQAIRQGGFVGIKSYLDRAPAHLDISQIQIFDFFPRHQLERLDRLGGIVMLHIPRNDRLKDPVNLEQIMQIKRDYPNLRLIIAHVGRAYLESDIGNAFDVLKGAPDLMFDFSANCCEAAITEVIRQMGVKNVMFGMDMPILRMRCRRIQENGTYINLIPPGLYGDPQQDSHLREVSAQEAESITFFAYEELLALKRAAATLNLSAADIEDIMYNNAVNLIEGAKRSIYGEK